MSRTPAPQKRSPTLLRLALGFVYFHFGALKLFPDLSPAELLGTQTVMVVLRNAVDAHGALLLLAILEMAIGVGFVMNLFPRITLALFAVHMVGTFLPLFLLPELTFKFAPLAPNMDGQYILKNLVFVAAGWTVLYPSCFSRQRAADRKSATAAPTGPA